MIPITNKMKLWVRSILLGALFSVTHAHAETAVEIARQPSVGMIGGSASGTYTSLGQDMANVFNAEGAPRLMVTLGSGSIQNIVDLFEVRGVDIVMVQSDVLAAATDETTGVPNFRSYVRYIAKLHNEEIHILAGRGIRNLKQLQSKRVGFGSLGSGTSMTAVVVFRALDIDVKPVHLPNADAVSAVKEGDLAAAVFVVGKPARYFDGVSRDDGLSFLPVEIDRKLEEAGYLSGRLTAADYPNLAIPARGVETISVSAVLAVYNWNAQNERYRRVKAFTERLFRNLRKLQRGDAYHPKWKEIDLTADVPGWVRSTPAKEEVLRRR